MSQIEKLKQKFNRCPIPNDISPEDAERLAKYYGCIFEHSGGKHPHKVINLEYNAVIPIPIHGKYIKEIYVKKLKELFDEIEADM